MEKDEGLILVEKYLTVVKKNLLMKEKDDIINDLRDNILEQLDGDYSLDNVKIVLEDFGNPALLATKYYDTKNYLIGPKIYNIYLYVMKLCVQYGSIIFLITILSVGGVNLFLKDFNILGFIGSSISSYIGMLFQIFVWTTLTFAVLERTLSIKDVDSVLQKSLNWNISKLNNVKLETDIKKSNVIATIIMIPIVFIFVVYFRDFTIEVNGISYYVLNQNIMTTAITLFGICELLDMIIQILLLKQGTWTKKLILFDLFFQLVNIAITYYLIVELKLINLLEMGIFKQYSDNIYLGITVCAIITAIATTFYSLYKFYKKS